MEYPHSKIVEARAATAAAVDVVRDGVLFSVIAGTNLAWPVFPADGGMARADASSRAAAKQAVTGLRASGGTAIGQWLELARQTLEPLLKSNVDAQLHARAEELLRDNSR